MSMTTAEKQRYLDNFRSPFCNGEEKYEKVIKIGQGTFGEVFKAKYKSNPNKFVAMKKVLMENEKEGFPTTALREIKLLQMLKNENIVNLIEVCTAIVNKKSIIYLVFEFCEHDLAGLLRNRNVKFSLSEIKQVVKQMLNGLFFIHVNKIMHRDLKTANILITKTGVLKLADFGLSRPFSSLKVAQQYTNRVVTLWYRPPELLLGERNYGPSIDLWGAGCIIAEMWTRCPIIQGHSEQQQLLLITQFCGSITPEVWPGVEKTPLYNKIVLAKDEPNKIVEKLEPFVKCPLGLDLIQKLLVLDPSKRYDADTALNHDFFWSDPMPGGLAKMLTQHSHSMFEFLTRGRK